ncbi:Wadjet anti-phage system protein JetD domain-containing protein [Roseateles noduli]|uniref:Wadjet anti-phage system protein JetD domain-containing protein n=1 Tax=Roseateles noduli TaxID=2052484 RepID=UPI003D658B73
MKHPDDMLRFIKQRYLRQRWRWLEGSGAWPYQVSLERPTQKETLANPAGVRAWSSAWQAWRNEPSVAKLRPELSSVTMSWSGLGTQTLPDRLTFPSAESVAEYCGDLGTWRLVAQRRGQMLELWPALEKAGFGAHYEMLATYSKADFQRLLDLLTWLVANPRSNLLLRQLPVRGLDTKWIDLRRRGMVADLVRRILMPPSAAAAIEPLAPQEGDENTAALLPVEIAGDFYEICGLRKPPPRIRILVLCPELRTHIGGLRDVEADVEDWMGSRLRPDRLLIVENKESGLCLPDIPGAVAVIKLGNAVSLLKQLAWLRDVPAVYWGDIDTHGYSILTQARKVFPRIRSVLMDEGTLEGHLDRLVDEPQQTRAVDTSLLTVEELAVYTGLLEGRWGASQRLEQERLEWPSALRAVTAELWVESMN